MLYTNANVFTPSGFIKGGFTVEDGRFAEVFEDDRAGGVDLGGAAVIPGLVDIHTHGAAGADFSDGDAEGLTRMAAHLAKRGVEAFSARLRQKIGCQHVRFDPHVPVVLREFRQPMKQRPISPKLSSLFFYA